MQPRAQPNEQLRVVLQQAKAKRRRLASDLMAARMEMNRLRERLQQAMAAAAAQEDFQAVFRASPDILLLLTPDFHMVDASEVRVKATNVPREDIAGRYLFDVFPDNPDNEDAIGKSNLHASLVRVLQTRQPDEMALQRYDLARPDGTFEERYWRPLNVPVLGPDGEVRYIIHRVEDATTTMQLAASEADRAREHDQAQQAQALANTQLMEKVAELEVAHDMLDGVLKSAVSGIVVLKAIRDAHGRITNFTIRLLNPAGEKIIGKGLQQLQGTTVLDNWPGHAQAGLFDLYVRVADTGIPGEMELHYASEGFDMWLSVSVVKVGDDGVAITFTDTTERQLTAARIASQLEALRQADQMKDQFLGILSHELRTPINAIMGFSSVMADGLAGDMNPDQTRYVGKILDSSDALLGLVNDLLDMSRVQAGKFALDLQTVAVAPLVRTALAGLAVEAINKGLSVACEVPPDLPAIQGDPQRLSQVLDNMITNAIKYTPEGGVITTHAAVRGDVIRVEVADTGLGVSADQQARIFQPFTQVDMTTTRARGGVGLGLSIVKALVEAHGGEVGVESAGEGHGSMFWFTLPLPAR
jgi:signal transduction histidine kinase